jgi:hypothetical protein
VDQVLREALEVARRPSGPRQMQSIDESPAVRPSCRAGDAYRIREARDLTPRHALEIDPHAEARRKIAKLGEVRDEARTIRIIPADAEPFGPEFASRFEHRGDARGQEICIDRHEFDIIDTDALAAEAAAHLAHRFAAGWDLVGRRAREGGMKTQADSGEADPCRETSSIGGTSITVK